MDYLPCLEIADMLPCLWWLAEAARDTQQAHGLAREGLVDLPKMIILQWAYRVIQSRWEAEALEEWDLHCLPLLMEPIACSAP